jgi:type I restriction enzyme S subunit
LRSVALADLGRIVSGATPKTQMSEYWGGSIPWVTPADLAKNDDVFFRGPCKRITEAGYESCSTVLLPSGSILFSSRAPIGHSAIVASPMCTNQGFKSFVPGPDVDSAFAYFAIRAVTPRIISAGRGATFAEVNTDIMESVRLPYTDITDQRRIGVRLLIAHRLVRTLRFALERSEGLLGAVFLEMFGNRARPRAECSWTVVTDLCESITDCVNKTAPLAEGRTPYCMVRTSNVRRGEIDVENVRYVDRSTYQAWTRRSKPEWGDVILTREAPLGEVGILRTHKSMFLGQRLVQYRVQPAKCTPEFLSYGLMSQDVQDQLRRLGNGSTVEHVAVPDCAELVVPNAPLPMQKKFSEIERTFDRLKASHREQLRQAEHLFQTLLHGAFGEAA